MKQRRDPFSGPQWIQQINVPFKFPSILIGKFTKAFLTSQSWCILKSWYPDGGSEQGFRCGFANRLNQSFRVSFVGQAIVHLSDLLSGNYPGLEWVLLSSWKTLWFFYPGVLFCFTFLITAHIYTTLPNGGQNKMTKKLFKG